MSERTDIFAPANYFFQDKSPVYLFTNENISGYLDGLYLENARVLTVCASGDHAFEAYLRGASHVDTFDINSWQGAIFELKNHMIRNLDYEVFMDFFFHAKYFFDTKLLKPIKPAFSDRLNEFLAHYNKVGRDAFKYKSSTNPFYSDKMISYINNKKMYDTLAEKLPKKINFKHCSMADVSTNFHKRYDLILLSNIFEYMYNQYKFINQEEKILSFYKDCLIKLCDKNLNFTGGNICFSYMWNAEPYPWRNFIEYFNDRYFYEKRKSNRHEIHATSFKSAELGCDWDIVLILHKTRQENLLLKLMQKCI